MRVFDGTLKVAAALVAHLLVLVPYAPVRARADDFGFRRLQDPIISAEELIGLGATPTERAQALYGGFGALEWILLLAYVSFFVCGVVVFAVVALQDWSALPKLLLCYAALYYISAAMFVLMPVEPPWMALGSDRLLLDSGVGFDANVDPNQVAAFPSLHVATPVLFTVFSIARGYRWWPLLAVHSLLTACSVVYFGEHYVIDVLAGSALACGVAHVLARRGRGAMRDVTVSPAGTPQLRHSPASRFM